VGGRADCPESCKKKAKKTNTILEEKTVYGFAQTTPRLQGNRRGRGNKRKTKKKSTSFHKVKQGTKESPERKNTSIKKLRAGRKKLKPRLGAKKGTRKWCRGSKTPKT